MQNAIRRGMVGTQRELALLLLASFAIVIVLTVNLVRGQQHLGERGLIEFSASDLLLFALVGGAAAGALGLVALTTRAALRAISRAESETAGLRRKLAMAEAIIKAEAQVLVFWVEGLGLKVVTHTLNTVPGLPSGQRELLRFGAWLEPRSAADLKAALDDLFGEGRPFSLILRTAADGYLETDGRAAGGRAVLRFRDVAGYKRDLLKILDQHRNLTRDIRACRGLLNAMPMPVWIRGSDGRIEWVNRAYVAAVDASDEAEVTSRQLELLETRQRAAVTQAVAGGARFAQRMALFAGGGRRIHDVTVLPVDDATIGVAIDATELVEAKGRLERQIAAYDRTLDQVATAVALFGRDQRLTFFNDAFRKLWQFDEAWLKDGPTNGELLDRLREHSRLPPMKEYAAWKARILSGGSDGAPLEESWHLPDGRILQVVAEQWPDGGISFLYDDVTERIALESRYNELFNVQRETLDSLTEGVAVFGTDGRLKLFNSALLRIWHMSRATLEGRPHVTGFISEARVLCEATSEWTRIARAVTSLRDARGPIQGQMLRPDASVIEFAVIPLPDGASLVTFTDVTASKQYERALIERNEALLASDRLKNQFIGHVSYELRTPLTNIIGFSELLAAPRTGPLSPKQRDYLNDITASSKTLLSIIDDILDLATIDAGAVELKLAPIDVRAIIDDAIAGVREPASRARLTVDIAVTEDARTFVADEARVRQVLYNLLSNAIGFSPQGETVRITAWREAGLMKFSVEDEGPGIPADQLERIFERFESRSRGSKHRGAGLGLSIVKRLVGLHGGEVAIDSEPGLGTRVTVSFPVAGVVPAAAPSEDEAIGRSGKLAT